MIIEAGIHEGLYWVWLILEIASAGVFLHAGIKFPYFVFFAKDSGLRPGDPPKHMLAAMAFLSFICLFLGFYPQPLYDILPYPVDFVAYTWDHTVNQLQLLMFSALAFFLLLPMLRRTETISLDTDWFYRRGGQLFYLVAERSFNRLNSWGDQLFVRRLPAALARFFVDPADRLHSWFVAPYYKMTGKDLPADDSGRCERSAYPIGGGVLLAVLFLALMSFLFFL
jgi:multicomponent Na+:H+ antiporter subunit D